MLLISTVISKDLVHQYNDLIASGLSKTAAAKSLGHSTQGFAYAADQLGIEITPLKESAKSIFIRRIDEFVCDGWTQAQIAKELDVPRPWISKLCRERGVLSKHDKAQSYVDRHDRVLDFLMQHGGEVTDAIRHFGLPKSCSRLVHERARERNIDVNHYRYSFREYGHWRIEPGPYEKSGKTDHKLLATCRLCGTQHWVSRLNLESGNSTMCASCWKKQPRYVLPVICVETGELFKTMGRAARRACVNYETFKYHLKRHGQYVAGGHTFRFADSL